MKLYLSDRANKQLKKLPKSYRTKVDRKVLALANNPFLGKKLEDDLAGLRSYRAWPYRVIYKIEGKKVIIISILHRQGACK
jgi:mRNA-degrading endonuclease RelE of RelBE toxin-antitoxin system